MNWSNGYHFAFDKPVSMLARSSGESLRQQPVDAGRAVPELDPQDARRQRASFDVRHAQIIRAKRLLYARVKPHDPIARLEEMEAKAALAGGEARIEKQHEAGKLTARERIDLAARPGQLRRARHASSPTAAPTSAWQEQKVLGDGVVTGLRHSSTAARCSSSRRTSPSSAARSRGAYAQKICKVMDLAMKVGAPVIGLNDSGGARIQEGVESLAGYADIFLRNTLASAASSRRSARSWARARAAPCTRPPSPTSS